MTAPLDGAGADWVLDRFLDHAGCGTCGSRTPARTEGAVCSDCADFPCCASCRIWVGSGTGLLPKYVRVLVEGAPAVLCAKCWEAAR